MPERIDAAYRGKRLLLFQRILESSQLVYPDIVRDMIGGCCIIGGMGVAGILPPKFFGLGLHGGIVGTCTALPQVGHRLHAAIRER